MATTLNVRNPRAHELASELAQRRRTGITEAVIQALEHELERERSSTPLAQRLAALADRALAKAGPNPRPVTEADRDGMWTR
ncbi:hypothetical protein OPKNFCMD_5312 [Methylobacterium crusticola]|uniref:Transcription factor n=1 Tax=Methylobacterium crusticola TaxID=1697972 RepID=A0ABQ4R4C5_9HYPH|nr:type II toxin-antitoxin system VapB family antitoxin [Methylobacterium crusticola]GJD52546.1 hypothetical protein OPKNFCMD_5312 [Methylobacterium crusticola]